MNTEQAERLLKSAAKDLIIDPQDYSAILDIQDAMYILDPSFMDAWNRDRIRIKSSPPAHRGWWNSFWCK